MGSNQKFRINTIIFCVIIISVMSLGHAVGIMIKAGIELNQNLYDIQNSDFSESTKQQLIDNLQNVSKVDVGSVIGGIGDIMLGLDLPFPFSLIIALFNIILISLIVYCFAFIIRAYIPFLPGD